MNIRTPVFLIPALLFFVVSHPACGTVYEVGPGKKLKTIGSVPWQSLLPGDRVTISWQPEPYREKWVIARQGTARQPIVIEGMKGPDGQLPVIDGENAVTVSNPDYWGGNRSVIKLGGSEDTKRVPPAYIVINNLEVRNGRPPFGFLDRKGAGAKYAPHAAGIWIESGDHITLSGCSIHDCANGLFSSHESQGILVERCHIYDNGLERNIYSHNIYTESNGITFQYNRLGPLRRDCFGNNLKDRSAGLVVRYNWIEGGNRELDLVDADDSSVLRAEPSYRKTFIYGNVIIEPENDGNNQIVHYGGDMGKPDTYRKGTLYFYNNTVVSRRTDRTVLFRLSTNDEHVDCRNNILNVAGPGGVMAMLDSAGQLDLVNNWVNTGWTNSSSRLNGSVKAVGLLTGNDPGFVDQSAADFHLTAGSVCRGADAPLLSDESDENRVLNEYVSPQSGRPRPGVAGSKDATDLGAFGF